MNKTYFIALDELHCTAYRMKPYDENTIKAENILEFSLERLAKIDKLLQKYKMSDRELNIALDFVKSGYPIETKSHLDKFRALEIIKPYIHIDKLEHENTCYLTIKEECIQISKEEYYLLKEVLK